MELLPMGNLAEKLVPPTTTAAAGNQQFGEPGLVLLINVEPAPLKGQCTTRLVPLNEVLMNRGAAIPPTASATGRVLPLKSKNEEVL